MKRTVSWKSCSLQQGRCIAIVQSSSGFMPKFVMDDMMAPANAKHVLKAMGMKGF